MINSLFLKKSMFVLGIFSLTTFVTYWATNSSEGLMKSSPYQARNATADTMLNRLTNGIGAGILDGVIVTVKTKAEEKGGSPINTTLYNAYLDDYLNRIDQLDNVTKSTYGSDYAFLFQYIYPRVAELKKEDTKIVSLIQDFKNMVGLSATTNITSPSSSVSSDTGTMSVSSQTGISQATTTNTGPTTTTVAENANTVNKFVNVDIFGLTAGSQGYEPVQSGRTLTFRYTTNGMRQCQWLIYKNWDTSFRWQYVQFVQNGGSSNSTDLEKGEFNLLIDAPTRIEFNCYTTPENTKKTVTIDIKTIAPTSPVTTPTLSLKNANGTSLAGSSIGLNDNITASTSPFSASNIDSYRLKIDGNELNTVYTATTATATSATFGFGVGSHVVSIKGCNKNICSEFGNSISFVVTAPISANVSSQSMTATTVQSSPAIEKRYTQAQMNAYIDELNTNDPNNAITRLIADIRRAEWEWYVWVRELVAVRLNMTLQQVNEYIASH